MNAVLHLVAHDLATHRRLLVAWLVVVLAHPVFALLPWSALSAMGFVPSQALIVARLALGAVAIATIVQTDSPLDDRTFWRTRPIGADVMATAKLVIGVLFVCVPLVVVIAVAMLVGVPARHLPSTITQVVVSDAAVVGLALVLALRTRAIAPMLIALIGTLVGGYLLLAAASETLRVPWVRQWYAAGQPSAQLAAPTMLVVLVMTTWPMAVLVFLGHRLRLLLVCAAGVVGLAIVWFVPAARLHQPSPRVELHPSLSVDAARIAAQRLESGRVALIAEGSLLNLLPGDRTRQYLLEGTIEASDGSRAARQLRDPRFLAGLPERQPVLLGVLSPEDFGRLAGRPVRFAGRIDIEVARTEILGTLPVATGASLDLGDMRMHIRELGPSVRTRPAMVPLAAVDVTWTAFWTDGTPLPAAQWWLRNGKARHHLGHFAERPFAGLVLLPSLARPFGRERRVVYGRRDVETRIEPGSSIEIEASRGPVHRQQSLEMDFVVPATTTPFRAVRGAE